MESKGQVLGFDLDDAAYIPVGRALELFDRDGVMEIDLLYTPSASVDELVASIRRLLLLRHGQEDFTVITQQQMLDVLGSVLGVLKSAVGALGGISLLVGGVGILTIMTLAVRERTAEIGLLRALGAERWQVLVLFLAEAPASEGSRDWRPGWAGPGFSPGWSRPCRSTRPGASPCWPRRSPSPSDWPRGSFPPAAPPTSIRCAPCAAIDSRRACGGRSGRGVFPFAPPQARGV